MAISKRLKSFLDTARIHYSVTTHPVAYTAQEIAAAQHVPGRQLAKSVLIKTDGGLRLAVLPAIYLIDLKKLKAALRAKTVAIAKESDIKTAFPDVEVGAMSPFGNLYGVPVIVDRGLEGSEHIAFNGGSHQETVKCTFKDFASAAKPQLAQIALTPKKSASKKKATKSKNLKKKNKKPTRKKSASKKHSTRR